MSDVGDHPPKNSPDAGEASRAKTERAAGPVESLMKNAGSALMILGIGLALPFQGFSLLLAEIGGATFFAGMCLIVLASTGGAVSARFAARKVGGVPSNETPHEAISVSPGSGGPTDGLARTAFGAPGRLDGPRTRAQTRWTVRAAGVAARLGSGNFLDELVAAAIPDEETLFRCWTAAEGGSARGRVLVAATDRRVCLIEHTVAANATKMLDAFPYDEITQVEGEHLGRLASWARNAPAYGWFSPRLTLHRKRGHVRLKLSENEVNDLFAILRTRAAVDLPDCGFGRSRK